MNETTFWSVIEQSRARYSSHAGQVAALRILLSKLEAPEVIDFDRIFQQMVIKAYTWDLWGAAYILNGGCSDDSFEYFRRGLIAEGRSKFEAAVNDPNSLGDWAEPDELEFEEISGVAPAVVEEKTGAKMPRHASTSTSPPCDPTTRPCRATS